MTIRPDQIANAYLEWIEGKPFGPSIAVTLTFRQFDGKQISRKLAENAISHYLRVLDRKAFGAQARRGKRQLGAFGVFEGDAESWGKNLHYHCLLQIPSHVMPEQWIRTCEMEWAKVRYSNRQHHFEEVWDEAGWSEYLLKLRDKKDYADAVDVINIRMPK